MTDQQLPQQAIPGIIELLQHYSIKIDDIAKACKLDLETVCDALSIVAFNSCPLFAIASVRTTLHRMLKERGWKGDKKEIWGKHDIRFLFTRR